ncbi:MAG: type V CRISPR-associated protein Cas12a/Cpf1 [Bacteroidales bacterium]|nr:type V CRISPR-associated protein Cas12a/Cpf1 [Bacteroidales bacterium]
MRTFDKLTKLFSLSKTLRFELKPVGKTLDNIEKKGLIAQDEQRAEEYELVKTIIDDYHKFFIRFSLNSLVLKLKRTSNEGLDSLEEYVELASKSKRNENEESAFDKVKENLRKQIVKAFKDTNGYGDLFKKELIQNVLPDYLTDATQRQLVDNFSKFTTYFSGFHQNRENMYSDEAKSTAIAYRLIHENLPMFIDNIKSFAKIADTEVKEHFSDIKKAYEECLNVNEIADIFKLDNFTRTLPQEQIDVYNSITGGINEYVNLYNQQHKDQRLPLLKPLYKMILSDREALSRLPEEFASDEEMIAAINETHEKLKEVLTGNGDSSLQYLLQHIEDFDTDHIYIANDASLTDISQQIFGQYDVYTRGIKEDIRQQVKPTAKERKDSELLDERISKIFKTANSFSIGYLNSMSDKKIEDYFAQLGAYDRDGEQRVNIFCKIEMARIAAGDILAGKHSNLNQSDSDIKLIKDLMDAYKDLQHFIKPLLGNGDEADKDIDFDARLRAVWVALDVITPLYNKVRNWLTRKPYNEEKIKLNFENPVLLEGWPNPEANSCVILKEDDNTYYLAIMDNDYRSLLRECLSPTSDDDVMFRMNYLQGGDMGKNVQNLMMIDGKVRKVNGRKEKTGPFAGQNIRLEESKMEHLPAEINRIRKSGSYSVSSKTFLKEDLTKFIDFYKPLTCAYYSDYLFSFRESSHYQTFADFTDHINQQAYQIQFSPVSKSYIHELVNEGKLYLFQIWNKDFSEHSKGTPNMHTLYWKMLFDERNLADVVYKLNGQAEVFYRKRSLDIDKTAIHKAHQPIQNKNSQNTKRESTFDYDIIKNRRYTVDKFQFHVPITLNFKAVGNDNINANVQDVIRNNGIEHIIGIDRGERHLLYLSLIDLRGNIVKQMTLNDIVNEYNGNTYTTNYKDLLAAREGDRTDARRNWQKIENIKELKEGYLSQVVHIIAKMMVDYKAIVVLEDLNMGFMRGRQKIERNVYEQFEKKLIEKLNYYVDKRKDATECGGVLNALQLASKFESFKKLGKQSGCLFYIPAWNTSKIDPVTGFTNLLDTRYENADKARCFFSKFDSIKYNKDKDWFELAFDYNNFTPKAEGTRTKWTLCTHGTRVMTFRNPEKVNQWDNKEIVLTDEFKRVLNEAGIDIHGNLKESICSLEGKENASVLKDLMGLMKLLLQMRNSITKTEIDYLLSPVADENGDFYDSRTCADNLPKDADANGAYNIARKGLWVIDQIKQTKERLAITNKEWLDYAQKRPYLK